MDCYNCTARRVSARGTEPLNASIKWGDMEPHFGAFPEEIC